MNILWLAWKDHTHPERGGAEVVLRELIKRQVAEGHNVTLLTAKHAGAPSREKLDGIDVIRVGNNRFIHPLQALSYYLRHLRGRYDLIIETVNTAPYFSLWFRGKAKAFAFYHQLARDIWFQETKAPLSHLGYYVLEPVATWLLARAKAPLITISDSTKRDLARFGWNQKHTHLISEGIEIEPVANLSKVKKYDQPTMLAFGTLRGMKRNLDQVEAFEIAKKVIPNLKFKIAGDASNPYGQQVLKRIEYSPFAADIELLARRTTLEEKIELMRRSHVFTSAAMKEGWGLTITEANSQGTPAVVYDADGLRDSVIHDKTGLITAPNPVALANGIVTLLADRPQYEKLQRNAWEWSKQINFDQSYKDFKQIMEVTI
jgi:glycosyltransferase involved in cell wall biosynthesis